MTASGIATPMPIFNPKLAPELTSIAEVGDALATDDVKVAGTDDIADVAEGAL